MKICYLFHNYKSRNYSSYINNINPFKFLDLISCVAPIGIFLGRIANFLNSKPEEIIWTRNTSESLNIVAKGLSKSISEDNNIVISKIKSIEKMILNNPKQWIWSHNRWK